MPERHSFHSIFFYNEFRELTGRKYKVIIRLIGLLLITITALGVAIGGLEQLEKRMDNPFTNWVDLEVNEGFDRNSLPQMERYLGHPDTLEAYNLSQIDKWKLFWLKFYPNDFDPFAKKISDAFIRTGRSVNLDDSLFSVIIRPIGGNLVYRNKHFFDEDDNLTDRTGVVITENLAHKLGFEVYDQIMRLPVSSPNDTGRVIYLPLIAVVKQLPNKAAFVSSPLIYNVLYGFDKPHCRKRLIQNAPDDSTAYHFISPHDDKIGYIESKIQTVLNVDKDYYTLNEPNLIAVRNNLNLFYYAIRLLDPVQNPSLNIARQFRDTLYKSGMFKPYFEIEQEDDCEQFAEAHYLTFKFNDTKKIRPFQHLMNDKFNIEVAMHQVESRENFDLVARLTSILGVILFLLGVLSIALYQGNLFLNHIENIRGNLGTFKAFGLDNRFLLRVYAKIVALMLGIGMLIAFPVSLLFGLMLQQQLDIGFNLISVKILISILLILFFSLIFTHFVIRTVLKSTPGDLIYER